MRRVSARTPLPGATRPLADGGASECSSEEREIETRAKAFELRAKGEKRRASLLPPVLTFGGVCCAVLARGVVVAAQRSTLATLLQPIDWLVPQRSITQTVASVTRPSHEPHNNARLPTTHAFPLPRSNAFPPSQHYTPPPTHHTTGRQAFARPNQTMAPPSTMPATTTTDAATSEGGGGEAFDRRRPLFDGALPVEVVSSGASGASSREGQQLTVRVLRGARGQHGGERVLRLEVGVGGWSVF